MSIRWVRISLIAFLLSVAAHRFVHGQTGQPSLTGSITAVGGHPSGALYLDLRLTNAGSGLAQNVRITQLPLRTLTGTGTVTYNTTLSPALPLAVDNLAAGASTTVRLYFSLPSTVSRFSITENGTLQNSAGTTFNFSIAQSVIIPANKAPTVTIGPDQTVPLSGSAALNGAVTDDGFPLGSTQTVAWSKVSGPGNVTFTNANAAVTTARFSVAGTYVLRLTANDSLLTGSAQTTVTVNPSTTTITATADRPPNTAGWYDANVVVSFTCSGAAACSAPVTVSTEGANQTITGTALDGSGNVLGTASLVINLDKTPPVLTMSSPANGTTVFMADIIAAGTVTDLSGVASATCNGAPGTISGTSLSCNVILTPGSNSISVRATDLAGNNSTTTLALTYTRVPKVTITAPANLSYFNISPTTVSGTVDDPTATVTINSIPAAVAGGNFSVALPLAEGPNIVTASASSNGAVGTASIEVTLDTTPPHVTITSPPDKFMTSETSISVAGNVNDIVVGTVNDQQARITVNGVSAQVANRTFLATNVALNIGDNVIQVVGTDRVGNFATTQVNVTRQALTPSQIRLISGNNQTGAIGAALSAPLVIALTDSTGNPASNKPVIFKVTQNDGLVSSGGTPAATVIATTNAQGQAQVNLTLGMRAGAGGNAVETYSVGFGGTAIFTATGTQGPAGKIVVDTGNDQIGAIGQTLPKPLIVAVVDNGNNRLGGVPVTFTVKTGGGNLEGLSSLSAPVTFTLSQANPAAGSQSVTVTTDSDGRAAATLILGLQEGNANNLVEVTFPNNLGFPAAFTASGRAPGDPAKTTITGAVLDNSNVPIPNVTIRAVLTNLLHSSAASVQTAATVQTDTQGQFTIPQAPVGFVKLLVDGSTAQRPGTYPSLEYDLVTVAGQTNTIGSPIYLLPLNTNNQLCVTATTGSGTLTIPEAPGFSLTFGPGQVTFPGGSKTGCVSVTVVHGDKVPMVPGFGQQPRFIVTIQPSGASFNPPAPITLPNVDGLKPRAITEMYSFDHDIGSFVAIGTGVVSDDGQVIRSSTGVGVLKAGWHCGGNPGARGTVADCPACQFCQGANASSVSCIPFPGAVGTSCGPTGNQCITGECGGTLGSGTEPNRPTGQCVLNFVNAPCFINGRSGFCYGGLCRGTPNECSCPGGTCVNGLCVNPPCTPGSICTTGDSFPGMCNSARQCIGEGTGRCSSPTTLNLNGICVVPDCSTLGTNGLSCNAGGNLPGICVNNQCEGTGDQCPDSCNGNTCTNGRCGGCSDSTKETIRGEYLPSTQGGVYPGGVTPTPTCSDIEYHSDRNLRITPNFTWAEFNDSWTGGGNSYTYYGIVRLSLKAGLEATRSNYGAPIYLSGGYRSPRGNASFPGAVPTSLHMQGRAVDMYGNSAHTWTETEFNLLRQAVLDTGTSSEVFRYDTYSDHHLHAAW